MPPELSGLRDITGLESLPPEPAGSGWAIALGLGGGLLATLFLVVASRRFRHHPAPPPSPETWACRELERLLAQQPPPPSDQFHVCLADIVRQFLERRFSLPASTRTTREFLEEIARSPTWGLPQREQLAAILERCDWAKFSGLALDGEACRRSAELVREFIRQWECLPGPTSAPPK
ncbi:MAG: hypothetical protein NZ700_03365 [Gemmataceae bacterium]|nr:hypothetical protein [Gemmataceae bacterium]MDW8267089.1 hypothetical protein [Gemmataceae bacterium]